MSFVNVVYFFLEPSESLKLFCKFVLHVTGTSKMPSRISIETVDYSGDEGNIG